MTPTALRPTRAPLALLLLLIALLAAGCGDHGDDHDTAKASGSGAAVDLAFAQEMIPHHRSAVEMAKIAKERSTRPEVTGLADAIISSQNAEITQLQGIVQRLTDDGVKPGSLGVPGHDMGMDGDVAALRTAKPFDLEFLTMMLPHHQGAVTMSRAVIRGGSDPEVEKLANAIIDAQQREIGQMTAWIADWYSADAAEDAVHGTGHSG